MGACTEVRTVYARSASEAIDNLTDEAIYESGHDIYSGTIATCSGWAQEGKLDQKAFTKAAIERWIAKWVDDIGKRDIIYLELPKSYSKGKGRGVRKYIVIYCGAC